jgi:putative ABC transport system ATP-binding protein
LQALAREEDRALILITHDQRILSIADRLLHLEDGLLSGGTLATE